MDNLQQQPDVPKILFVDDEEPVLSALKRFAKKRKWEADTANSGIQALIMAENTQYDLIVSDMRMPQMTGADLLLEMKNRHPDTLRILLTGYSDIDALERVVNESKIYNYVTKPWNDFVLQDAIENGFNFVKSERERKRLEDLTLLQNKKLSRLALLLDRQLKESNMETKQALSLLEIQQSVLKERNIENEQALALLANQENMLRRAALDSLSIVTQILDWKEGREQGVTRFVEEYGQKIAKELCMNSHDAEQLRIASMLHRVGILGLPDELRTRPVFTFDKEERLLYERHPIWGEMALSSSVQLAPIARIIRHHQEYINGKGFPDQLIDNEIPLESKIICLVGDFIDAFNGRRVKGHSGMECAKSFIDEWAGKRYDSTLVSVFYEVLGDFGQEESKTKTIDISQLKEGQVLAQDIFANNGLLLLKKESIINFEQIERLQIHQKKFNDYMEIVIRDESHDEES